MTSKGAAADEDEFVFFPFFRPTLRAPSAAVGTVADTDRVAFGTLFAVTAQLLREVEPEVCRFVLDAITASLLGVHMSFVGQR